MFCYKEKNKMREKFNMKKIRYINLYEGITDSVEILK